MSHQKGAAAGSTIGRVANRIANARFVLDGRTYRLLRNDGNNTIHGKLQTSFYLFSPKPYAWTHDALVLI